jgi:(1->4)-alpha-D-glucan 1-alpha-D-glucosylmutase
MDLRAADAEGLSGFADRLAGWQRKALREAKLHSSWALPDEGYEAACEAYLRGLLAPADPFAAEAQAFVETIKAAGIVKSLAQATLRCTLPGVPDLYQGAEGWDFSLVDPDNRRPVDYAALITSLQEGSHPKQSLIAALLGLRRDHSELLGDGDFAAARLDGRRATDAVAFTRRWEGQTLIVLCALRSFAEARDLAPGWWGDTRLTIWDGRTIAAADLFGPDNFAPGQGVAAVRFL